MKQEVLKVLKKALKEQRIKIKDEEILNLIEIPKDNTKGDYAFPCFYLTKIVKENPHEIALDLRRNIGNPKYFKEIQIVGPYINFYTDKIPIFLDLMKKVKKEKNNFGKGNIGKGQKMVVEFSAPNIAKPFGVGHLRSTIIGNSIANISEFQGFKIKRLNYLGDWGTQFGKLITGFIEFGNQEKLKKNPVNHLYEIYVKVNKNKKYEEASRKWFNRLEKGDKEALNLWKDFNKWSLEEFNEIYSRLGIKFDEVLKESMYNDKMKKVIKELDEKKLTRKSEGAKIVSLKKDKLGVVLIEKSDGSTLYSTRDLASAIDRYKKYKFDIMIYEVGQEQKLHFKQLFKVLEKMGYEWSKNCKHIDHGLYLGKDGKKLATRKGKTVFMEDILNETEELAKIQIKKRFPKISKKELNERAKKVSKAAIFYGDLKNNRANNIIFDLERFVSFEGDTGPYIQYAYARASSILRKIEKVPELILPKELEEKENILIKKLSEFEQIAFEAYKQMNPALIAGYAYKLSQIFNEFYHACPVIGSESESFRLELIKIFRQVLKNSLYLLGIEVMEVM